MKKYILLIICVLLLSGCAKSEKLECVYTNDKEGNEYTSVMDIKVKNDYVVDAVVVITYKDEKAAKNMCDIYKMASDAKGNVKCSDNTITLKNYHKSLSEDKIKKKDYIKIMEKKGYIFK